MSPPASITASSATVGIPWLRVVLVGSLAGFASGLFGVGGGVIIVPALVFMAAFPHKLATGTSLTAILPISLAGLVGYARGDEVDWAAAACVSAGAMVGTVIGTRLLVTIRTPMLQVVFSGVMLLAAVRLLFEDADGSGRPDLTVAMALAMVALGLASGLLAGLLGVGGGILVVPALTLLFGVPHVLAKGTSLAQIIPVAIVGTIRNRQTGLTALRPAAAVGVSGMAAAAIGSQISLDLNPRVSAVLFAALLTFAAVRLARAGWRGLNHEDEAVGDEAEDGEAVEEAKVVE